MNLTDNEMCTILLSTYVGIDDKEDLKAKPLSLGEWYKFVDVLIKNKLEPSIVYGTEVSKLKELGYDDMFIERIKALAGRGARVGFELEEYEKRGIGVTTFIGREYPVMLKRRLKNKKPPVLFYSGDISLANKVGIGVVGSRKITDRGIEFADKLARKAADERLAVYSGGAKGADTVAQTATLKNGGIVVSYIADSLLSGIRKSAAARNLADGKLLLISDAKPDVGFFAGRALNRNKFIYASSMATFVVESDYNKGGTWAGATDALKNGWGKVLVWDNGIEGNTRLVEAGAAAYEITGEKLVDAISKPQGLTKYEQLRLDIS